MTKPCSVPGCERRHVAKGLCSAHYYQQREAERKGEIFSPTPVLPRNPARSSVLVEQPGGVVTTMETSKPGTGVSREMYLLRSDAAAEVGVSANTLSVMSKVLKVRTKRGSTTVYTVGDIAKLRQLKTFMDDLEVGPAMALKIIRAIEKRKARNMESEHAA